VTEDARKLNQAGQKVYPSIEIEPNFAGKGFAYLMGCALTDSPASIATQRLQFNRSLPGTLTLAGEKAAPLEFAEDTEGEPGAGFLAGLSGVIDRFTGKSKPARPRPTRPRLPIRARRRARLCAAAPCCAAVPKNSPPASARNGQEITSLRQEFRTEADALAVKLPARSRAGNTPRTSYRTAAADGQAANSAAYARRPPLPPRPPRIPSPQDLNTMGYNLSDRGRRALDGLYSAIAQRNGAARRRPPVFARSHLRTAA
jgi:hypothetical protein